MNRLLVPLLQYVAALLVCTLPLVTHGQVTQQAKLNASDASPGQAFGYSVSLDGDYALVGNPANAPSDTGAYVFKRTGSTWTQQQKLTASNPSGISVALSGSYALLGAVSAGDGFAGSAYVFERNGSVWTQQAHLVASDATAGDTFGQFVSIDGNYAIIGARQDDDLGSDSGSAYIFERTGSTWTQQAKLLASDGGVEDYFGYSVSVHEDYALVGAPGDGSELGRAYVFIRSGSSWTQQAEFVTPAAVVDDFGVDVSINGDYALVGANIGNGAAYVYHRSGTNWALQATLTAPDGYAGQIFGDAVSLFGDFALVGARGDDAIAGDAGAAYLFQRSGASWTLLDKITAADGTASDFFGISVALSGQSALIGAYTDTDFGEDSGSAYVFSVPEPSTLTLAALGLAAGFLARRRRRHAR